MLKITGRKGFVLVDSVVGLMIIATFSILYIQLETQMNHHLDQARQELVRERHHYERRIFEK